MCVFPNLALQKGFGNRLIFMHGMIANSCKMSFNCVPLYGPFKLSVVGMSLIYFGLLRERGFSPFHQLQTYIIELWRINKSLFVEGFLIIK